MQSRNNTKLKRHIAAAVAAGLLTAVHSGVWAQASNAEAEQRSQAESRRQQEREQVQRQQLQPEVDVRLGAGAAPSIPQLPRNEIPCFRITHIALVGDVPEGWGHWLLPALDGAQGKDSPLFDRSGVCLGTQGIAIVLQRAQEALVAKGFVTSRVVVQGQDLSTGTLALTVVPGRLHEIRPDAGISLRGLHSALPMREGDILNLRDIEQALENFQRAPTTQADFQIAQASVPGQSDLLIRHQSSFPLRLSLSLDDSGSKSTGKYQASATLSWDNPLGLNDLFYVTQGNDAQGGDPGPRGNQSNTLHYSLPWGYWAFGLTSTETSYYQTISGSTTGYTYSGGGGSNELKASRLFYRDATRKDTVYLKALERHARNYINSTEVMIQRRASAL